MTITIPLDKMTTKEKLLALENIWEDLCKNPEEIPSPAWHKDVLKKREEKIKKGEENFVDWLYAKKKISESIS